MAVIELQVPGGTVHGERRESRYEDVAPLIALHAGVADSRSWSTVFDLLEGLPPLVAYDRRGYGASPLPDAGYDSVDDLASVLNQTASERVWPLGNSFGGRLALDLAVTHPECVAGLILLSPGVSGAPKMEFDETTALLFDAAARAFRAGDLAAAAAIEAQIWLDGPTAAHGRVAGAARSLALEMNMAALASDTDRERLERDPGVLAWDRLEALTMPVTVACGLLDVGAVIDAGRAIADRIPAPGSASSKMSRTCRRSRRPSVSPSSCAARCWRPRGCPETLSVSEWPAWWRLPALGGRRSPRRSRCRSAHRECPPGQSGRSSRSRPGSRSRG